MAKPNTNAQVLGEAKTIQQKTRDSILRTQAQINESEIIGGETLQQLREQREQVGRIQCDIDQTDESLIKTKKMMNRFDKWSFHFSGKNRRAAAAEANESMKRDKKRRSIVKRMKSLPGSIKQSRRGSDLTKNGSLIVKSVKSADSNDVRGGGGVGYSQEDVDKLDAESKAGLADIKKNDDDIDQMLDHVAFSLDKLTALSMSIQEETRAQTKVLEEMDDGMDGVTKDFREVNGRIRRYVK
mmetsp:Transcript_33370/g.44244  ORF Transcript_33370/g.44244 Transcript_33370/m.44244 type:complete len:241 (-) Transcript_33370:137-859(-)